MPNSVSTYLGAAKLVMKIAFLFDESNQFYYIKVMLAYNEFSKHEVRVANLRSAKESWQVSLKRNKSAFIPAYFSGN